MEKLDSVATQIKEATMAADEADRKRILNSLKELQYSIEKPKDTMQRISHCYMLTKEQHLVLSTIRTVLDLKVFNILVDSSGPVHLDALSKQSGADPILLGRLLRMLSSLGIIKETAEDEFGASTMTENLSIPEIQAGVYFSHDVLGPTFQALPEFLSSNGYQNVVETHKAAFQMGWNTNLPMWEWLHQRPKEIAHFNRFMTAQRSGTPNCFNFYPIEDKCKDWRAGDDRAVFVDVGGASGQQCVEFKKKFSNIPGRVILQDLPAVIEDACADGLPNGVEAMVHDFYKPQPVRGAKFYYLRAILHDHSDDKSILILKNIKEAMDQDSLILLDEIALPNQNIDWFATQTDITMLTAFGSMERTETQWNKLLESVGLRLQTISTYTYAHRLSIIAASL
ncbi:O-methyltransferase lepI [Lachnellula suecica]|uniref:O-methyltransferase lepI n=1 Tax=Lachnellula suecica TaxID=602035 RepID=A0A8T9C3Z7_9HELO|nr:O-methyltransferase lepI [Lachnellula suecica]